MACHLIISGKFDPQTIVRGLTFPIQRTWREGDLRRGGHVSEESGIRVRVSSAGFDDYKKQFSDAEEFLRAYHEEIAAVTTRDDTAEAVLDFGMAQAPHPAYFRRIPAALVRLAADLRLAIELSFYACADRTSSA